MSALVADESNGSDFGGGGDGGDGGDGLGAPPPTELGGVEREVKLGVWPGFRLPDLVGIGATASVDVAPDRTLDATYYDTADLRLARRDITLRYRTGEGGHGRWTLKLPAGDSTFEGLVRHEVEAEGEPDALPPELFDRIAALVRTAPLAPVARLQTLRQVVVLRDADGEALVEVVDDEVSSFDGDRLALRFREVEAELGPAGDLELLAAVVERLRAAGAAAPDPVPKLFRVLGPRAQEPPDRITLTLPDEPTAADVVRHAFARSVARLVDHDPIAREGDDPEGVHQARVATRRLRSDLRVFRPLVDEAWVEEIGNELKWLGSALGEVRDADVLLARLRGRLDDLDAVDWPAALGLLDTLRSTRSVAAARLETALRSERYLALLERLVAGLDDVPFTKAAGRPAARVLPPLAAGPVRTLTRKAERALRHNDVVPDEVLHEVRILAKRARYAAEVAATVVGKQAQRFADRIGDVQGVLGDHQDACVARAWLREAAAGSCSEIALVAGQLMEVERAEASRLRAAWPEVWAGASRGKDRAWLT